MTTRIDVWSDFVCPYCFAMSLSLSELQTTHDVAIEWHAFELRPAGSPPPAPEYLARIQQAQPRLKQMFAEQHGVEIKHGPFGAGSRDAHIAAKWAEAQDAAAAARFHDLLFRAYFTRAEAVDQLAVLRRCAEEAGLNADALEAVLASPEARAPYETLVDTDIMQASAYELTGVPALIIEDRYLVPGAVPTDTLRNIIAQIETGQVATR